MNRRQFVGGCIAVGMSAGMTKTNEAVCTRVRLLCVTYSERQTHWSYNAHYSDGGCASFGTERPVPEARLRELLGTRRPHRFPVAGGRFDWVSPIDDVLFDVADHSQQQGWIRGGYVPREKR